VTEDITMQRTLKKTPLVLPLLFLLLTLGLAACGESSATSSASLATATPNAPVASATSNAPANEVDIGPFTFVQDNRTITAGDHIHFVVGQEAHAHILCLGSLGKCNASATGPQDLTGQGFIIEPGQSRDVRFDKAGTYSITCSLHPRMNVVVTVR
jgi:plastocyanin